MNSELISKMIHPPSIGQFIILSPMELAEAKRQIEYMLQHGFIRPSQSQDDALVLFAPKKDGGLRFCIDYWWLKKKTIGNRYPLPLPEEIFDRLGTGVSSAKFTCKLAIGKCPSESKTSRRRRSKLAGGYLNT